ncbi:MAG: hypothetical protein PSV46_11125 [Reyranella sp.]|nr:hypothetical protein [Reyranella sp.]
MTIGSAAFLPGSAPAMPLPTCSPSMAGSGAPPSCRLPLDLAPGARLGIRLLLAEPPAVTALDLQRTLREAGYQIVGPAATAAETRALIDRGAIDGAIVDLDLDPGPVTAIVGLLDRAAIPVLFLSGAALNELPTRHRTGTLLAKPYSRANLLQVVGGLFARGLADEGTWYPVSPQPVSWPRVFPQL